MKKTFVKTSNVKKFITMMNHLQKRAEGVPGMGLVYGEPGLGKTYAISWWCLANNAVYIRCVNTMTTKWLLEELSEELGEIPYARTPDIFNQVISQLLKQPRTIIVDEIDYLAMDSIEIVPINLKTLGKYIPELYKSKNIESASFLVKNRLR